MEYRDKLVQLAELVELDQRLTLVKRGLDCPVNLENIKTRIVEGSKYDKVNVGSSGRLMVECRTGIIYGIKGYGQVHKGHCYGTLDTIDSWYWGEYSPYMKETD